ncbi:hypothetical protein IP92_02640 [Pseudoduganella flava]|uniref:DUF7931 domain-containing protein n=1 Tax=Pseudoduganella flava TaxID=871742 RepID=A0A562PTT0_9BURK|nr:hypothetical protein [Pseudoduganella flava]QGZ39132.1 hypothetical protein GO485_08810 [Pseudoduganella flava]TWI47580.1 hypothetical protein IP92_02640 [Pseudoduganella flava]
MDRQTFDTRAGFQAQLDECLSRATLTLAMFDPDYGWWELGGVHSDALLRTFLRQGGRLQLAAHSNAKLERDAPRFLRLLRDYSHLIECRLTNRTLHQLTDSFCVADERHVVRRFHSDHFRGEAIFDDPSSTQTPLERFQGIWTETQPGLHANVTGL